MKKQRKPQYMKQTMRRLFSYLIKRPVPLIVIVLLVVWSGFTNVYGIYLMREIVDKYVLNFDLAGLNKALIKLAIIFGSGALSALIYNPLMVKYSQTVIAQIRNELFAHSQKLSLAYFDKTPRGEIMNYFTNDVDTLNQALNTGFTTIIYSTVTGIGTIVFLFLINFYLSLIVVFFIALMFFMVLRNSQKMRVAFSSVQKHTAILNSYVEEMMLGLKVSAMFSHQTADMAEFSKRNDELTKSGIYANTLVLRKTPMIVSLSYFNYAISAIAGALFVLNGWLSVGALGSYLIYVRQSSNPFNNFMTELNALYNGLSGAERIFAFLDLEGEVDEGKVRLVSAVEIDGKIVETEHPTHSLAWKIPTQTGYTYEIFKGRVDFTDVIFGYKKDERVLNNISLHAEKGEKVALVGSTGAGKTTIINLITRFYEIYSGTINYDGIDIRHIKKSDLRQSVSVVIQDTHLFTGTIFENIAYPSPGATMAEVERAAKIAHAHDFIIKLPQGYDTLLYDNGANLSSGQRQLIAIARAAILQPPVLILDEATSSIDTRSERLIEKAMDELMEDKTVFVIAHRLSTIRNAKAILVMEKGSIIERGSHEDLILEGKVYYQLYTGQFEWT
ncbi:MAG: putative ABC transporter ATP-binding protein [Tenericutes bacterium ADurb.Bin087]|nr:MAG: putative ABC transporter ATP-binding protein [Tenericutes bacterium ADurb.Bin087]